MLRCDFRLVLEVLDFRIRGLLEGFLWSRDVNLAELGSTCQTSGRVAVCHSTKSRPDICSVFDVQTGIAAALSSTNLVLKDYQIIYNLYRPPLVNSRRCNDRDG